MFETPRQILALWFCVTLALGLAGCGPGDAQSPAICEDTCSSASDGVCDDGGAGADFNTCAYGSDCNDCGERMAEEAPAEAPAEAPLCDNTCPSARDGVCDDDSGPLPTPMCRPGTDCADCGPREDIQRCENDADCGLWRVCGPDALCELPAYGNHTEHLTIFEREVIADELTQAAFELPAGIASAILIVEAASPHTAITLEKIFDPDDRFIFNADAPQSHRIAVLPTGRGGQLMVFFGNTPDDAILGGEYGVQFTTGDTTEVRVSLLIKRLADEPRGGRLQVNVWFPPDTTLSAETAPDAPDFQLALRELRQIYARIDLDIGPITFQNMEGVHATALTLPPSHFRICQDLREAMGESEHPGVNVVIASRFATGTRRGLECGTPGIPSWPGLSRSGVIVSGALLETSPRRLGQAMAHEIGHDLGLFHTTESDGRRHDPIDDTPECSLARDRNQNQVLSADECIDADGSNTMFWASPQDASISQQALTAGQRFVVMRNPMVETY